LPELKVQIEESAQAVRELTRFKPDIAMILGTGLSALARVIRKVKVIPYERLPHFPLSTVESHTGQLVFGTLEGKKVVAMEGRFHRYEGYTLQQVVFPVRVLRQLGARTLLVSNACGGMNRAYRPGDLMIIEDHINLMGDNPLIGRNDDTLGPRFPDMYQTYDPALRALARQTARALRITVHEGVYVAVTGPNLETAAEYRFLRMIGADAVGMSTVPEVIAARHAGMKVMGISVVTDECVADALQPADVPKIIRTAMNAEPRLTALFRSVIRKMKV
jgi:purine-nucleoside phosphorylase